MDYLNRSGSESLNIFSASTFNESETPHEFSASYRDRKAALLNEYREQCASDKECQLRSTNHSSPKTLHKTKKKEWSPLLRSKVAVLALVAVLAIAPAVGYAVSSNADFFANAFGNDSRESVLAQNVGLGQGSRTSSVTYPTREYVDVDLEEAENLLGDHLMTTPVEAYADNHKITVLSAVRDSNSAVIHYTVSCENGVTALAWDDLSNQGKGAYITNDSPILWRFGIYDSPSEQASSHNYFGSTVLVNTKQTNDNFIDCYEYAIAKHPLSDEDEVALQICARQDGSVLESYAFPEMTPLSSIKFVSNDGSKIDLSAISLEVGGIMDAELGQDPSFDRIEIEYSDGAKYMVYDRGANLDNTCYVLGRSMTEASNDLVIIFNRLVNPASVKSITINGIEFTKL